MNMTIKERINGIAFENLTAEDFEFLKERALKSVRKPSEHKGLTKAQKENEGFKNKILEILTEKGAMTATQVGAEFGWSGSQKASALLKQMVDAGTVTKAKEGKATVFSAVTEVE
jgi:predicted HTH transcriptional regulator